MAEILVVDDDPKVLAATGETLELHGYSAVLTESPEDALRLLQKNPRRFDLILLDWKLQSSIDGDMMLKVLKHIFPIFKTPIIFVTAHTRVSSKYLMRLGAYDTLAKPVDAEQLIDAVERALKKKNEDDPHLNVPASANATDFKKHETMKKIIHAVTAARSMKEAASMLQCSRMTLYRWLKTSGLDQFFTEKDSRHNREEG